MEGVMGKLHVLPADSFGLNFITKEYIPVGEDEYYLRFKQNSEKNHRWRALTLGELESLIKNGNSCTDWNKILVEDPFNAHLIKNSFFAGLVRISALEENYLKYHDFTVPTGITNSKIISSDIGKNCAIHDCAYISHYIIGDHVILSRIDELCATNNAKFGEGIIKEGEDESVRISIEVINEAGGREVLPFAEMIPADAFLWARYRDNKKLIERFKKITQEQRDNRRGYYGIIGSEAVIKSCCIIKDVSFGESVYVKGANKLKNLTVKSSSNEPTQIGEGVELVNGIIGFGCRIFYGVKAIRFVLGNNSALKYGTRFIHSILGDNSTISCCEVLNSLIFPYHEQHHNNSFLIATMIQGQSNMAAGATVGSNHNTRGNDGEIIAGRGFWPGLSSTLKHNCKFASFVLLNKGNYPSELNISFPFSLVSENAQKNRLEIMPAYHWMYNMYALIRNNKKFATRDKRITKIQKIETNCFAPDTAMEMEDAIAELNSLIEQTWQKAGNPFLSAKKIIASHEAEIRNMLIIVPNAERLKERESVLLKPIEAWHAYHDMLIWYGVKTLFDFFEKEHCSIKKFEHITLEEVERNWVNMGGQLVPEKKLFALMDRIANGDFLTWNQIHEEYEVLYAQYPYDKAENAYAVLCRIKGVSKLTKELWNEYIDESLRIRKFIEEEILKTKLKDYTNPFRDITYRNKAERDAVLGKVEDNPIIQESKIETEYFFSQAEKMRL
ncbi:hypothetical protein HMPREF9554_01404 [Treponema phagedenis F0421]|nr:hypothetical protein HMPREF9554_01404 [Treponema phagedenis F0421]